MHQQTLNLHELVSLMDVAWLSIESIVSYYWQWEQSLVMELQSSSLLHCQHYYLLGMSSTCVCICLMEGCVLYTSRQDDYASPGHMAMHISCCRCDISQKHANIFPSISQSVNCVNCICCVSSISDVEFLWCEVVSDWDSLNWVIAWDVTTLSFTCSGLSLQTCLVDKWFASIVSFASFGCLQVNVLFGCFKEGLYSASTSSMTRSWWVQLLWINSVDSSPSCNCSILEPGPCVGGGNFGSKFAGFTASFILVNWWIRQLNFVKLCQLCHLFAMMSVPVADGSLPIVVMAPGVIQEACLIDWSAFWVVCPLYKIDKVLLVGSELLAGHCISWAGSSGEMAKVQGEPWFK